MANDKVKVVGYAQKQVFNGNIEYRNFSDDLVGLQQTDGQSTFTFGNFAITTTIDSKPSKIFTTNKFSKFVSLLDLDLTPEESQVLLKNNSEVRLKLDKTNICNYAYFGSFLEYVRVSLEEIITKWPAALYLNPSKGLSTTNLTVEDYNYEALVDEATFKVGTNIIRNQYKLNFLQNGTIINTFNEENDLRNITVNYESYSVAKDSIEYPVLEFTGATSLENDYIHLRVKGDPFNDITGITATTIYHIKPNKLKEDTFFNLLPDFQANLLNRFTVPLYTSTYKFPERSETGSLIYKTKTLTWPSTDGYNIDFDSTQYISFVNDLIDMAKDFDENKTNLMVRFLTSESISDFDTVPRCDGNQEETAGQKMNRTLKIYGREYDEIKRYIDGIQYANTVSYDQVNNTPDVILKYLARTMGWQLVSSILENDLLKSYVTSNPSTYSGMSVGYTAIEAEVEMWRRIILNTPWIWKSKGARKSIEFLFKFIGAPDGLIEFNEFIYLAKNKIDVDLFKILLEQNGLDTDIDLYNIDSDGYPRVLNNTRDMYFQKGGLWYRETAGTGATPDILYGNNPHVGPYDGGAEYINQFNSLIPDFSAVTVTSTTVTTGTTQLFSNYDSGTINSYVGDYFIDIVSDEDVALEDCVVVTTTKIPDPFPTSEEITECGCEVEEDDYALQIDIGCDCEQQPEETTCEETIIDVMETEDGYFVFSYNVLDINGNPTGDSWTSNYASQECCKIYGGTPIYDEEWNIWQSKDGVIKQLINCGYICCITGKCGCSVTCDWELYTTDISQMPSFSPHSGKFLVFLKPNGETTSMVPTGCSCIAGYTTPVEITDPATGESGIGCLLHQEGLEDIGTSTQQYTYSLTNSNTYEVIIYVPIYDEGAVLEPEYPLYNSWIEAVYSGRADGILPCDLYMNNEVEIPKND